MPKHLNFTNALQGRKWLSLLTEDPISGIRLRPNLEIAEEYLGFSFSSNDIGLCGPCSLDADNVILGTSFAMGFGVNDGENWYEGILNKDKWFNAGFPVGPEEWKGILEKYYTGNRDFALLLYHPNIWPHAVAYEKQKRSGKSVFDYFGWKTRLWDCLVIQIYKTMAQVKLQKCGKRIFYRRNHYNLAFNSNYCKTYGILKDPELDSAVISLSNLLKTFKRVICLRIPIKEQLLPEGNL